MQEIAFEIDAQRVGRASGYLGGLTVERYTFTGATLPAGTRLAILTRAGVTIAAAEITEGNAATVDTNTQEVADLLRYQPLGACESVYIALGDADNILALIPATMRKNWLDDEATHPPVPANRYPTKAELDEWLARFDERAAAAETAKADAQSAAALAAQRATAALAAKTDAESAATAAKTAQGKAEAAQVASETAQKGAEAAKEAAAQSATEAAQSAQEAAADVTALLQGKVESAEAAKAGAESAKGQAEESARDASTSASNASTSAKQAEDAKNAIGDAGERLDKVETYGVFPKRDGIYSMIEPNVKTSFANGSAKHLPTIISQGYFVVASASNASVWCVDMYTSAVKSTYKLDTASLTPPLKVGNKCILLTKATRYEFTILNEGFLDVEDANVAKTALATAPTITSSNVLGVFDNGFILCTNGIYSSANGLLVKAFESRTTNLIPAIYNNARDGFVVPFIDGNLCDVKVDDEGTPTLTVIATNSRFKSGQRVPIANGSKGTGGSVTNTPWMDLGNVYENGYTADFQTITAVGSATNQTGALLASYKTLLFDNLINTIRGIAILYWGNGGSGGAGYSYKRNMFKFQRTYSGARSLPYKDSQCLMYVMPDSWGYWKNSYFVAVKKDLA